MIGLISLIITGFVGFILVTVVSQVFGTNTELVVSLNTVLVIALILIPVFVVRRESKKRLDAISSRFDRNAVLRGEADPETMMAAIDVVIDTKLNSVAKATANYTRR